MSSINNIGTKKNKLNTFKKYQNKVNLELKKHISSNFPKCIQPMINYMVDGGKRLRSILSLIFGNIESIEDECLITDIAISIELIHCLSLVIDDTPSMDNDDFRRERPSFHKKFGLAKTNLTIYYLINKITLLFSKYDFKTTNIIDVLNCNLNNLIEGQCLDINLNKTEIQKYDEEYYKKKRYLDTSSFINEYQVIFDILPKDFNSNKLDMFIKNINLNFLKTSSLFCLSILTPFYIHHSQIGINNAELDEDILKEIKIFSNLFGIAFQYSDDILDIEQDKLSNNPNITFLIGVEQTINFIRNILSYLQSSLPSILNKMNVYSSDKLQVVFEIFTIISDRCNKVLQLEA